MPAPKDPNHRQVNPHRESTGSDYYTVKKYDPVLQLCDLYPGGTHQRGILTKVPIAQIGASSWEDQIFHEPALSSKMDPEQWGQVCRGPKAGVSWPIQPGDLALVQFRGESQSDPVITAFMRQDLGLGIPWTANQAIGRRDDKYKQRLPQDDAKLKDRYDVLLPSGAWIRSTKEGSITLSTPPVHNARCFLSLDSEGRIKIEGRDQFENNYIVRFEMTPNKGQGEARIAVGPDTDSSFVWFTAEGDVHVRAQNNKRISLLADGETSVGMELDASKGQLFMACGQSVGIAAVESSGEGCAGLRGGRAWDPAQTSFIQMNAQGDMQINAPRSLRVYAGSVAVDVGGD